MPIDINSNLLRNIDPDDNFFDDYYQCLGTEKQSIYYSIDNYNHLCSNSKKFITFLNYNIRSFNANFDSFICIFEENNIPDIIVLTETWFNSNTVQDIVNYNAYHTVRETARSGGVSIFVKDTYQVNLIPELCICNDAIEICGVQLYISGTAMIILGIYRPHSNSIDSFIIALNEVLHNTLANNKNVILLGDFNINLLHNIPPIDNFINNLNSYYFIPIITKPTRFPKQGNPSLLDQIWINKLTNYHSGVVLCDITDHCPTFLRIPIITNDYLNAKTKITFRLVNSANKDKFSHMLRNLNLDSVRDRNINIFTDALISRINEIYCTCFPLKIKYISNKQINNPWVDRSILNLIKKNRNISNYSDWR